MSVPSLINGSAGKPKLAIVGRKCECRACAATFAKGDRCAIFPNPRSMQSDKRLCRLCFGLVLQKTQSDLSKLAALFEYPVESGQ